MKKNFWALIALILIAGSSCYGQNQQDKESLEENKKISILYHQRNLKDIDKVLADDFIGSFYFEEPEARIWDKDSHRNAIINNPDTKDSILFQIAEGDWVATRFVRTSPYEGRIAKAEIMQFKQFRNGKIIKSFELISPLLELE